MKILRLDLDIFFLLLPQLLYFTLFYFWPSSYSLFNSEYTLVETLSAFFYLLAFLYLLPLNFNKNTSNKLILIFTLLSLIFLLEETNWLQNYLDYSIEFIESKNSNNAVNIHNLEFFQGGSLFKSPLSINLVTKSQNIFRLFFTTYFIVFPLLYTLNLRFKKWLERVGYINVKNSFLFCLILNLFINLFLFFLVQGNSFEYEFSKSLAETRELIYSMSIFSYITTLKRNKNLIKI